MGTGGKIVISLGIASSALFAAWLFTGNRKDKTKDLVSIISRKADTIKDALKTDKRLAADDQEIYYI